ncbi:hypothetical protein L0156_10360 [bacterium]|nr:hypothetical protein [bacterium]
MSRRSFLTVHDLSNDEIAKAFLIAKLAEKGEIFLRGKILALCFLSESTVTSSSLKASMIRQGGGWIGLEGITGTHIEAKNQSHNDTLVCLSSFSDVVAIRGPNRACGWFTTSSVPLINALSRDEHPLPAIWLLFLLHNIFETITGKSIGVIVATRFSPTITSYYRLLSRYGLRFHEFSVLNELRMKRYIVNEIEKNGSNFFQEDSPDFLRSMDFLIVAPHASLTWAPERLVRKFSKELRPIDYEMFKNLPRNSYWFFVPHVVLIATKRLTRIWKRNQMYESAIV